MSDALLIADTLHRRYRMGRAELHVLRGCDLQVREGEFVAVMGRSGSGKSTLLHVLGALDLPQSGEVYYAGEPVCGTQNRTEQTARTLNRILNIIQRVLLYIAVISILVGGTAILGTSIVLILMRYFWPYSTTSLPPEDTITALYILGQTIGYSLVGAIVLALIRLGLITIGDVRRDRFRRRSFGFVFQSYHLLPELNVLENVLLPRMIGGFFLSWFGNRQAARRDALQIIERVGLSDRLKHKPNELSGGERQRVAIARALVHKPRVLLADEPTGNLDATAGRRIMDLLAELHREGQTIVMVTHDEAIASYADRKLLLREGQLHPADDVGRAVPAKT